MNMFINWENDGYEIRNFKDEKGALRSRPQNTDTFFNEYITWSKISSGSVAFRYKPYGNIYDVAGTSIFTQNKDTLLYILGMVNGKVAHSILSVLSPTLNYEAGQIANIPIVNYARCCSDDGTDPVNTVNWIVAQNIAISNTDGDSFETSWDFRKHPLM